MKCPKCASTQTQKNGHRQGRQNYRCKTCGRQFIESQIQKGYSSEIKEICLRMHRNGIGFREMERITGISHNTIINWTRREELSIDSANTDSQTTDDSELEPLEVLV
jgi:transposase-like protein